MKGIDSTRHGAYTQRITEWRACRAATSGGVAIKEGGFLVKPTRRTWTPEDDDDWKLYNALAIYYNGTGRTVEGLVGLVFKVPPSIEAPAGAENLIDEVTSDLQSLVDVARTCVTEIVIVGRVGVLVDYPEGDERGLTVADRLRLGRRPMIAVYLAESIMDWRVENINNKAQLAFVKLKETVVVPDPIDEFSHLSVEQYRVLDMVAVNPPDRGRPGVARVYRQRVFRKNEKQEWVQISEVFPLTLGQYFDFIPFTFIGAEGTQTDPTDSPIADLARLNIAHYQNSADYEWGLHYAGSPTAIFSGAFAPGGDGNDDVLEIRLGSRSGIHFQDPTGSAKYLEFTGQGLDAIAKAMDTKWDAMAALGARLLAPERRQVESAETALIHRGGETSVLANIANVVSDALSWCMNILIRWAGVSTAGEFKLRLNTEYVPMALDAGVLDSLVKSWMANALTIKDLYYNFHRSGAISPDQSYEEWKESLESAAPPQLINNPMSGNAQNGNG
jgi:hypothetical protein